MIKKILLAIVGVFVLLSVYVAFQPSDFKIERAQLIASSADKIFPYINHSQKANEWMPWLESDPETKMNYSGPEEGVGSTAQWESTGKMGVGKAVVIESIPLQKVVTELTYTKPMEMNQLATVTLAPHGDKETIVTWAVTGKNNFMGRFICLFMNMDKMVGQEFEKGLLKLKSITEAL